jgi:hypothetical protein
MGGKIGGRVGVEQYEMDNPLWWVRHHKANVRYLCIRIHQLLDEPDNEEYRKFFFNHFHATLPEFLKSTGWPEEDPQAPVVEG